MRHLLLAPLLVVPLLLAGCAEPEPRGSADGTSTPSPEPTATVAPAEEVTAEPGGAAEPTAGKGSGTGSGGGAAKPRPTSGPAAAPCPFDALRIALGPDDAGAGSIGRDIVFTNISRVACTLSGPPAVFAMGPDGDQVGRTADWTARTGPVVRLAPGGRAIALLTNVDVRDDGGPLGSGCAVVQGDGFAVTPPGEGRFEVLKHGVGVCESQDYDVLTVSPVRAA